MNMISTLRQRVRQYGTATITASEYDQLQAEWITRTQLEPSGYCALGDKCNCGGDTEGVRSGCQNWKGSNEKVNSVAEGDPMEAGGRNES